MSQDYFFETPSIDRIMKVTMAMARELHVTRNRLKCLEFILQDAGLLDRARLDAFQPSEAQQKELLQERDMFVETILSPITADPIA